MEYGILVESVCPARWQFGADLFVYGKELVVYIIRIHPQKHIQFANKHNIGLSIWLTQFEITAGILSNTVYV